MNSSQLRLLSDLRAIKSEPPEGCSASPASEDNLYLWTATIFGPEETPWEASGTLGGIFSLKLQFTEHYPAKPPRVRFTCEMFHPNVYADGNICMDTLQDKWSPCHNVNSVLMSIQSMLTDPNCSSPANPEAAQLFIKDKAAYNRRVRRVAAKSVESC